MEFFRHCPQCGRRFHVKLESKKLVTEHRESVPTASTVTVRGGGRMIASFTPAILQEGKPVIIDFEEFHYTYKCGHCGHEWSEEHTEGRKET